MAPSVSRAKRYVLRYASLLPPMGVALAAAALAGTAIGCYDNNTGQVQVGGAIRFELPAFPESGSYPVEVFTEMHYQPSYRVQEVPRLQPPPESVPVTGRELKPTTMEEYTGLSVPDQSAGAYDPTTAQELYRVNCTVCHGSALRGDGPIRSFLTRGPFPADLTKELTKNATDGELFGFITGGGRQGLSARLRGRESSSPMPEFGRLLTEGERWALVQYLRSQIGR